MNRAMLLALPLCLLAACVTTEDGREVDNKEAAKANVDLGVAYLKQGNLQVAKDKLERAAKQDPKLPEVYWVMATLFERMELPKEADQSYQKAMNLAPANSQIVNTYAVFLCKQGEIDRALPMFEKAISDKLYKTPYAAAANAGMCLREDKRNADAQRYYERALALGPGFVDAAVGLSDLQLALGNPEAARRTVDTSLGNNSKSADLLVVGVRAAVAQHDCGGTQSYARALRREFPNAAQTSALPQLLGSCANLAR
jgi:type IV pilus assembly protein PilF